MNTGIYKFHEGAQTGVFGNIFELFVQRKIFNLYTCSDCGKVVFFLLRKFD